MDGGGVGGWVSPRIHLWIHGGQPFNSFLGVALDGVVYFIAGQEECFGSTAYIEESDCSFKSAKAKLLFLLYPRWIRWVGVVSVLWRGTWSILSICHGLSFPGGQRTQHRILGINR